MKGKVCGVASVLAIVLLPAFKCPASEDLLATVVKQHKPYTISLALKFSKKDRNFLLRALSFLDVGPNGHASGFLVGEGLVMTSYHVVSGKLSAPKMKLLGFRPDDELDVQAYVNGCAATVVRVDKEADLALLRVCTSKPAQRPTFWTTPSQDEQLLLIAQPGEEKMIRRGKFTGLQMFRGSEYCSVKIDAEDGFSGSPVYNSKGEIVGVFCLYDWNRRIGLLSPAVKAQQFLAEYDASAQRHP